jgi:hypothetical protein
LPGVKGLAFLGFPLHPAGKPSAERAEHLRDVKIPMLFLQGTRDELAKLELLQPLIDRLGARATLKLLQDDGPFRFMCPRAPDARTRKSGPRCWTRCGVDRSDNSRVLNQPSNREDVPAGTSRDASGPHILALPPGPLR